MRLNNICKILSREVLARRAYPNPDKPRQTPLQEHIMATFPPRPTSQSSTKGPTPPQSTKTVSRQGQNKPVSGGASGAGKARGTASLPNIMRTSPKTTAKR
jgi:hypothetical protein